MSISTYLTQWLVELQKVCKSRVCKAAGGRRQQDADLPVICVVNAVIHQAYSCHDATTKILENPCRCKVTPVGLAGNVHAFSTLLHSTRAMSVAQRCARRLTGVGHVYTFYIPFHHVGDVPRLVFRQR